MKIKVQLQWTDYLNSQLLHMRPSGLGRVMLYGMFLVMAFGLIGGLYLFAVGQLDFQISYIMPIFIFAAIIPLYRYVILPNRVKKIFAQQKDLSSPFEIEFTDAGMSVSNEFGNSIRPWKNFVKWKEDKELLMLYHSDVMFSMIPKRFFADPQQIETIKSFLEKNNVPIAKKRSMTGCIIYIVLMIVIAWIVYINFRNTVSP